MPQNLYDMRITEVSLVDEPANSDARVVIVKAAGGDKFKPCDSCPDPDKCGQMGKCMAKGSGYKPMKKAQSPDDTPGEATNDGNSFDNDAAHTAAHLAEYRMDIENLSKALGEAEAKLTALEQRTQEAEAALVDANEVIKAKDAEITELKKSAAPQSEEEVLKNLDPGVRMLVEKARAESKAATEALAKMQAEREEAEAIAKAREIGVGDAAEIGPLLLRVRKGTTTDADAEKVEALLKAQAAADKTSSLYKSFGTPVAVDGNPEEVLKAKAKEIQAADKVSYEQAYAKAVEQNPAIYNAYIAKRRSA